MQYSFSVESLIVCVDFGSYLFHGSLGAFDVCTQVGRKVAHVTFVLVKWLYLLEVALPGPPSATSVRRIIKGAFFLYFFEKKSSKVCYIQKRSYLCNRKTERDSKFGLWCNGNTTDSGPVIPGSNPGSPTDEKKGKLLEKKQFPFLLFLPWAWLLRE